MRILIIEDDKFIRNSIRQTLEESSFIVDSAEDGEKGSYMGRTNDYDLIVLDLSLPYKDGRQVCTEIRENNKTTPIIILSITFDPYEKAKILNAGADDYLSKPFSFNELLARIRAILRRATAIIPEVLQIDDLVVDSGRQKVNRGDKMIYLTRKEFSLLEYLLRHRGLVVSRGMIMEHVWNAYSNPFSNTIEAHILNVRKKVDNVKGRRLIHTIPGRGYKLELLSSLSLR